MPALVPRGPTFRSARVTFVAALVLFIYTIVIGILNGLDLYQPDHDALITHVHAGTLGWITLALSGAALLMFGDDEAGAEGGTRVLAWSMTAAITFYVLAFFLGDKVFEDRIQRPFAGTVLLLVVLWFAVWLFRQNGKAISSSVARLGLLLAWMSLIIGSMLGVLLGLYTANGEIPGLDADTAAAVADGHPPAMVIGYLILAAMAVAEWLLRDDVPWSGSRLGAAQMWILFAAGVMANVGFVSGLEEELLGPANLLMIIGIVIMVARYRSDLLPAGWSGSGVGGFVRMSTLFLVVYIVLGTILISRVVSGAMDFDALTDSEVGLLLAFDHSMFIGVMTNLLFGVIASRYFLRSEANLADRVLLWGVNVGIAGFLVGLLTVSAPVKRISTPVMGLALLVGLGMYLKDLTGSGESPSPRDVEMAG